MSGREQAERLVEKLVRPEIRALKAYQVPDTSGMIKLDAMENPYQWPEATRKIWLNLMHDVSINRYPDPACTDLQEAIRQQMAIPEQYDVMFGNGSDELIQLMMMALASDGATVLAPEPGFVMYAMIAKFLRLNYRGVDLTADFELDLAAMDTALDAEQPVITFLAQPNNPTGNLWGEEKLRRIIENAPGLVVIDEAYTAFTDADYLHLLDDYDNVVIMRTLSKVGLAGLRLGILIGAPEWIREFNKVRMPYNINSLTQASAIFVTQHFEILQQQTRLLRDARQQLQQQLAAIDGIEVFASEANFILVRFHKVSAVEVHQYLLQRKLSVKNLHGSHHLLDSCLRLTVGTDNENELMLQWIGEAMSACC